MRLSREQWVELTGVTNKNAVFAMLMGVAGRLLSQFFDNFNGFILPDLQYWRFLCWNRQTNRTDCFTPCACMWGNYCASRIRIVIISGCFQIAILCPLPPLLPTPPSLRSTISPSQRSTGSYLMEDNAQDNQQILHTNQIDENLKFIFKNHIKSLRISI